MKNKLELVQTLFEKEGCNTLLVESLKNLKKDIELQHLSDAARALRSKDYQLIDGRYIKGRNLLEKAKIISSIRGGVKIYSIDKNIYVVQEEKNRI